MRSSYDKLVFSAGASLSDAMMTELKQQGIEVKTMVGLPLSPARTKLLDLPLRLRTPQGSEMRPLYQNQFGLLAKGLTPDGQRACSAVKRKIVGFSLEKRMHHVDKPTLVEAKKRPRRSQVGVMKGSSASHFEPGVKANWSHRVGHCLGGLEVEENLDPATRASNLAIYAAVERPVKEGVWNKDLTVDLEITTLQDENTVPSIVRYQSIWAKPKSSHFFSETVMISPKSTEFISRRALAAIETLRQYGLDEMNSTLTSSPSMR